MISWPRTKWSLPGAWDLSIRKLSIVCFFLSISVGCRNIRVWHIYYWRHQRCAFIDSPLIPGLWYSVRLNISGKNLILVRQKTKMSLESFCNALYQTQNLKMGIWLEIYHRSQIFRQLGSESPLQIECESGINMENAMPWRQQYLPLFHNQSTGQLLLSAHWCYVRSPNTSNATWCRCSPHQ